MAGVLEFGRAVRIAGIAHRCAAVEGNVNAEVRLVLEALYEVAVGARQNPPVDVLRVVA